MLSRDRFSISKSTRTNSSVLFRFLKAQVLVASVRCTPYVTCLFSYFFDFAHGAKKRSAEFCSPLVPPRLPASLIISFPLIRSTFLAFSASASLFLARGLTQIPRITQTRWLKPSGITTGKRNLVLGIRLLYLPIMVVICPGKRTHQFPGYFFIASLLRNAACT